MNGRLEYFRGLASQDETDDLSPLPSSPLNVLNKMIDALEEHVLEGELGYGKEHLHFVALGILSNEDGEE